MSDKQAPKERLRDIAERLQAVFMSSTREEQIVAIREWDRRSIQDGAWWLQRERALRARLQSTLKRNAELETRLKHLEGEGAKLGIRSIARAPALVEEAEELSQLSKQMKLDSVLADAFDLDEKEWFEETAD